MADLEKYRGYIKEIILCRAKFKYANSSLEKKPVFDRERDRYLLMVNGFEGKARKDTITRWLMSKSATVNSGFIMTG